MKKHWKKFAILGLVIAVAVMFCLPGAISAGSNEFATFTKTVSPSTVVIGEEVELTYTFTVTAGESNKLHKVGIIDPTVGFTGVKGEKGYIGTIWAGGTKSITGTLTVIPDKFGKLVNTATCNSSGVYEICVGGKWVDGKCVGGEEVWYSLEPIEATAVVNVVAPEGKEGKEGPKGGTGTKGSTGRAGEDVVRMFSTDGGNEDPWSLTSESVDKYMLESTTYAGKTTHIIVEIVFVVEQADGSLVFMAK